MLEAEAAACPPVEMRSVHAWIVGTAADVVAAAAAAVAGVEIGVVLVTWENVEAAGYLLELGITNLDFLLF